MALSNAFPCTFPGCKQILSTLERFLLHSRRHVNFDFNGDSDFESVLAKSNGTHFCTRCNFDTRSAIMFNEHLRQHLFIFPYKCAHCDINMKTIHDLKLHFRSDHPNIQLAFKFNENTTVLNIILDTISQDSDNIYFVMSSGRQTVFMKSDTSFWLIILFTSSDRIGVDNICMSKNMLGIINKVLLEEFPGYIVSDKDCCVGEDIKANIEKNASTILESLKAKDDKTRSSGKEFGKYGYNGSEFQCFPCKYMTKNRSEFGVHVWKEMHDENLGCCHERVKSCVLDGQMICSLTESVLYFLVHILNEKMSTCNVDDAGSFKDINIIDENVLNNLNTVQDEGTNSSCESIKHQTIEIKTVKDVKSVQNLCIDSDHNEPNSKYSKVHKSDTRNSTVPIDTTVAVEHILSAEAPLLESLSKPDNSKLDSTSEDICGNQFSTFPFGQYLKECSTNNELVELIHDVSPFPFVCKSCDFCCASKNLLNFHKGRCLKKNTPTGFLCPRCHLSWWSLNSLYKHIYFHLGSTLLNLYSCCFCGKCFTDLDSVRSHLTVTHPNEYLTNSNAVKVTTKTISFLKNILKCFVCGSGHTWPLEYSGHMKNKHGMSRLAKYLSTEFTESNSKDVMPVITFPKYLLFCADENIQDDTSHRISIFDMSFENRVEADLKSLNVDKSFPMVPMEIDQE